ncbi:MAG: methyltransferase MtaB domain-containing protein [Bacteroidota bacterium]
MRKRYTTLALDSASLLFGRSTHPVIRNGVTIGGGAVIPEIKFTLPPTDINEGSMADITAMFEDMVAGVCKRAVELHQNPIVVEFELLPEMTINPGWGELITVRLRNVLDDFRNRDGLLSLLRITPVDIRELQKPPLRRSGRETELLFDSFRRCARAGGDMLSIESTGGKEVTDPSIMAADLRGILFGTVLLGCADMEFLWGRICAIARETSTIAAGDTACGIGNTAMVLADQGYVPKVFAAVVRAVTAVRSLVAYEAGAVGPGKDCGYENAFLKAITGYPMSMEGKSAACAHFSSLGNIAGVYADLWSNESVQHIKLLSGMAPVVSMEQLIYDCRLFNVASKKGFALNFRDMLVDSDARLDPQAFILKPDVVLDLSTTIISDGDDYVRGVRTAKKAVEILEKGARTGEMLLPEREAGWIERMKIALEELPPSKREFFKEESDRWQGVVDFSQYEFSESGIEEGIIG